VIKYNRLKIFNRNIDHPSITNTLYSGGFLAMAFSFLVDFFRYVYNLPNLSSEYQQGYSNPWLVGPEVMDAWLLIISSLSRSIALLFISLALNQQITYRSRMPTPQNDQSDSEPLLRHSPTASIVSGANSLTGSRTILFHNDEEDDEEYLPIEPIVASSLKPEIPYYLQVVCKIGKNVLGSWQLILIFLWILRVTATVLNLYGIFKIEILSIWKLNFRKMTLLYIFLISEKQWNGHIGHCSL
jgi:hypothetical protein